MSTDIKQLLENVASGSVSVDDALLTLKEKPFEDIGYAPRWICTESCARASQR